MSTYSVSSKGLFGKVGEWADNHKGDLVFAAVALGVIGGGIRGCSYVVQNAGDVRSEKVVETLPIGQGNEFRYFRRNIKLNDDNYRWEIQDRDGKVFLKGSGFPTVDAAYFANKADSLSGELERKVSGTATEE